MPNVTNTAIEEKHMYWTGKPTAVLGALWRHVDNPDRLEGLSARIVNETRRSLGKRYRFSEVGSNTTHRGVVGVLHAIL